MKVKPAREVCASDEKDLIAMSNCLVLAHKFIRWLCTILKEIFGELLNERLNPDFCDVAMRFVCGMKHHSQKFILQHFKNIKQILIIFKFADSAKNKITLNIQRPGGAPANKPKISSILTERERNYVRLESQISSYGFFTFHNLYSQWIEIPENYVEILKNNIERKPKVNWRGCSQKMSSLFFG